MKVRDQQVKLMDIEFMFICTNMKMCFYVLI